MDYIEAMRAARRDGESLAAVVQGFCQFLSEVGEEYRHSRDDSKEAYDLAREWGGT